MSVDITSDAELESAVKELLALAGMPTSASLTAQSIQEAVDKLKTKLVSKPGNSGTSESFANPTTNNGEAPRHQNVLVVGQLGIALHQVKHLLSSHCPNITLAKNIEGALTSYQQEHASFIVIDVLMPTSREGLAVIQAIRQLSMKACISPEPQFVVLSTTNQEEHLADNCRSQGIKHVLDRQDGWQQSILDIFNGNQ